MGKDIIVSFKNITIEYFTEKQTLKAVNNVSLDIERGKVTAFVGESGGGNNDCIVTFALVSQPH